MSTRYDAIVVGGGPAGSAAAFSLSGSGARVLLLDRRDFPRDKLCAGVLTEKTLLALRRIFGETEQSLTEAGCLLGQNSEFVATWHKKPFLEGTSFVPFYFALRRELDAHLLNRVREQGVTVRASEEVRQVDVANAEVRTASGAVYRARSIIGADGVNSRVRRFLPGASKMRKQWQNGVAATVEITCRPEDFSDLDPRLGIHFGFVRQGYVWSFPVAGRVIVGICAVASSKGEHITRAFETYLKSAGFKGRAEFKGHPLPYGNYLATPAVKKVLLVGDAAGFADPLLGEGIFYALRSGELAAASLSQSSTRAHAFYVKALSAHLLRDFFWAQKIRRFLIGGLRVMGPGIMERIMRPGIRPILEAIHGRRGYDLMRKPGGGRVKGRGRASLNTQC